MPVVTTRPARQRRNPVVLAREWQRRLSEEGLSRSELAGELGVSRARVTQVLRLLELAPEAQEIVVALGDPLPKSAVSVRMLRELLELPAEEQTLTLGPLLAPCPLLDAHGLYGPLEQKVAKSRADA